MNENKNPIHEGLLDIFKRKKKNNNKSNNYIKVSDPEKRKAEYNLILSLVKSILNKHNDIKGIDIADNEQEYIDNFINGTRNYIQILEWDAWEGTNNRARDEQYLNEFNDKLMNIWTEIDKAIESNPNLHGKSDIDADWDDGYMNYVLYSDKSIKESSIQEGFFSKMKSNAEMKSLYQRFQQYKQRNQINDHAEELYNALNKIQYNDLNSFNKKWYDEIKSAIKSYIDKLNKEEQEKKDKQNKENEESSKWLSNFKDAPEWTEDNTKEVVKYINSKVIPALLTPEYKKKIREVIDKGFKDGTLVNKPNYDDDLYNNNKLPIIKAEYFEPHIIRIFKNTTQQLNILLRSYITYPIGDVFGAQFGDGDEGCIYLY